MPDARVFLESLQGRDLQTLTGARNRILGFANGNVVVATTQSPDGQPVPIAWIQDALDRLESAGELEISVESVGYRSAFVGAVLRELPGAETDTRPRRVRLASGGADEVAAEATRRSAMWDAAISRGGPDDVPPALLRELGIYGGAQGVWVDKSRTGSLGPSGATVAVLHTGRHYADDLADDGIVYHYPRTGRPSGRDLAEINATKRAGELKLPVFVVTQRGSARSVSRGWVAGFDDQDGLFLISFLEGRAAALFGEDPAESESFEAFDRRPRRRGTRPIRPGQQEFRFRVFRRYGTACAFCPVAATELLVAAHIIEKSAHGSDDPRNGLPLCANHHAAFDASLVAIEPESGTYFVRAGYTADGLNVVHRSLDHLQEMPHVEALTWRWTRRAAQEEWVRAS